jgi:hypothetical protein
MCASEEICVSELLLYFKHFPVSIFSESEQTQASQLWVCTFCFSTAPKSECNFNYFVENSPLSVESCEERLYYSEEYKNQANENILCILNKIKVKFYPMSLL